MTEKVTLSNGKTVEIPKEHSVVFYAPTYIDTYDPTSFINYLVDLNAVFYDPYQDRTVWEATFEIPFNTAAEVTCGYFAGGKVKSITPILTGVQVVLEQLVPVCKRLDEEATSADPSGYLHINCSYEKEDWNHLCMGTMAQVEVFVYDETNVTAMELKTAALENTFNELFPGKWAHLFEHETQKVTALNGDKCTVSVVFHED